MINTILIPLDGSQRAEYVLPLAARLARRDGGKLVLVRVVNTATNYWPAVTVPYPSMMEAVVAGELEEATTYLEKVATSAELAGLEIILIARHGVATPVILSVAMEYDADLIVMCSHGYTGVAHVIMGSVAEQIARHTNVPVLIVREGEGLPEVNPGELSQPLRVLVPLDGSARAEAALEPAAVLLMALVALGQKAAIHLVKSAEGQGQTIGWRQTAGHEGAVGQGQPAAPTITVMEEDEMLGGPRSLPRAKHYLSQTAELIKQGSLAPTISENNIAVTWSVALDTDVARAIVRVAENGEDAEGAGVFGGCELIAMSTHGRGGLQRLAMGSITERVLHSTKRPMLVVRPSENKHT